MNGISQRQRLLLVCVCFLLFFAAVFYYNYACPQISITEETILVPGLKKNYSLFFLADSHICLTDERDDPAVIEKERIRDRLFRYNGIPSWRYFDALIKSADSPDLIILGGDVADSAMFASLEYAEGVMAEQSDPCLFYAGNHDFEYGEEYYSEKAFSEYLPRLSILNRTGSYTIREYDDLIVFAADDFGNRISPEALHGFEEIVSAGKPVVVCLHVPLEPVTGDKTLVEKCKTLRGTTPDGRSLVTLGPDGCIPDKTTAEFMRLLLNENSPVFLVLAGHVHFYHRDHLNGRIVQIITGPAYQGEALRITLTGA